MEFAANPLPATYDYPTISPFHPELEEAKNRILDELSSNEGYQNVGKVNDVTLWRKLDPEDPEGIPIVKGNCIVKGVTTDAFVTCTNLPGMRFRWDNRYSGGHMLERTSTHTYTFYAAAKGVGSMVDPRDFTGAASAEGSGQRNKEILCWNVSADTGVPELPGVVRANIVFSGWHFVPMGNDIRVTHIVKLGLNGNIPMSLVKLLSKELPLCVGKARDVFYKIGFAPYAQFSPGETDTLAILQTADISAEDDFEYTFVFTTTPDAQFEIVYDHRKMYPLGVHISLEGSGVEVKDDEQGTIFIYCPTDDMETVTLKLSPRV